MKEQIEEMGKLCPFYEEGKCNLLEDEAAECNFDCDMCDFARTLYNAGYRKQSENTVEVVRCKVSNIMLGEDIKLCLAELKKKYTEGESNG